MHSIIEQIQSLNLGHPYKTNVSFQSMSWFGVGGPCDVVFKFDDMSSMISVLSKIPPNIPRVVIGATSNILIRDEGFRGIVIRPKFLTIKLLDQETIEVGSGVLDNSVAKFAAQHSISGLEFLYTIPGSIGGAVAMNAGCYGSDISKILLSVQGLNQSTNEIRNFSNQELGFSYRSNKISDFIWTSTVLKGIKVNNNDSIHKKMEELLVERNNSQPKSCKTGGSTFCNGDTYKVWQLLDSVGLRGYRIGGAHFSEKHCNFIINDGSAKAQNIIDLIELAEKLVLEKFNIKLKREIVII